MPILQSILPMLIGNLMTRGQRQLEAEKTKQDTLVKQEELKSLQRASKIAQTIYDNAQDMHAKGIISKPQLISILSDPKGPMARIAGLMGSFPQQGQQQPPQPSPPPSPFQPWATGGEQFTPPPEPQQGGGLPNQISQMLSNIPPQARDMIQKETGMFTSQQLKDSYVKMVDGKPWRIFVNAYNEEIGAVPEPTKVGPRVESGTSSMATEAYTGRPVPGSEIPINQPIDYQKVWNPDKGAYELVPMPKTLPPGGVAGPSLKLGQAPEIERIVEKGPLGEETTRFVNPHLQMGKGMTTGAPQPKSAEVAAKLTLAQQGIKELKTLKSLIFEEGGKINRKNLAAKAVPFGGLPLSKGREINAVAFRAMDAIQRAATGAAITKDEWPKYERSYVPASVLSSDEEIYNTWNSLGSFLKNYVDKLDPSGAQSKEILAEFESIMKVDKTTRKKPIGERAMELMDKWDTEKAAKMLREEYSEGEIKRYVGGK